MLRKLRNTNSEGFTLIELMIVIAIIGILAAIAIPNFISYRNKAFCNAAESDANQMEAALADYFSIPEHTGMPTTGSDSTVFLGYNLNDKGGDNTFTISGGPNDTITIIITDASTRCPQKYREAGNDWSHGNSQLYTKMMSPASY